jgi:hypothetical protein
MRIQQMLGYLGIGCAFWFAVALPNQDLDILACNRLACDVTRYSWRGENRDSIPLTEIRSAESETRVYYDRKGNQRVTHLLVLRKDDGYVTVTYNGIADQKRIAERVNNFIVRPQESGFIERVEEVHWMKWIFIAIVTGIGIKAALSSSSTPQLLYRRMR